MTNYAGVRPARMKKFSHTSDKRSTLSRLPLQLKSMLNSKSYLSATTIIFKINQLLEMKLNPGRWAEASKVDHHIQRYTWQHKLISSNIKITFTLTFNTKKKKPLESHNIWCVFQINTAGELKDSELIILYLSTGHNYQPVTFMSH